jgi:hypothetical protein
LLAVEVGLLSGVPLCISTNSGATWEQSSAPDLFWSSVACSADGTKLMATALDAYSTGGIFISTNSGATWTKTSAPDDVLWASIACSVDGTKLVAITYNGGVGPTNNLIYTSTNSGVTWVQTSLPTSGATVAVASSADGSKLVATANAAGFFTPGPIFTWQLVPTLNITVAGTNAVLSWPDLSSTAGYVLQQNSDLTTTNWIDVTDTPTLNLTNLQNQVLLSPTNGNSFYRLRSP